MSLSIAAPTLMKASKKEINILILGETGVGKSTFINGFVNYLTFNTMEEAAKDPKLLSLVPSSFVTTDKKTYETITVKTGTSKNENFTTGQSATQSSQVYRFEMGDHVIRIIDTPGIGDVRGIEQDEVNFQNILDTISNLDYLHGILILLKPNDARLNVIFKFCVTELLSHLHKSAINNIVFGFTNTRGTCYAPGETMPALKALLASKPNVKIVLNRDTIYCFDSESYRFLAATKHGIEFDEGLQKAFAESWNYSVKETHRLIEHIFQAKPHPIHDTTTLNSARKMIISLTKPLAEVTRLIDVNKKVFQDTIKELQTTEKHGDELNDALLVQKIDLEPRQLGYPRTVCTNAACIEVRDWEGRKKVNYVTHCHKQWSLKGVCVDTVNAAALLHCSAMSNGSCRCCGHGYQEHMHIVYELLEVKKTIEDQNIKSQIDDNTSDAEKKRIVIDQLEQLLEEYQEEHKIVEKAAAEFGCFLKHNAILPYSDARLEYLDYLLKEERAKAQVSGDDRTVNSLEETKRMYLEQFRIIDKSIGDGSNLQVLEPRHVAKVETKLLRLKHFGQTLKIVRNVGNAAQKLTYKEIPFKAPKKSSFIQKIKKRYLKL